jgi:hypothetical protein
MQTIKPSSLQTFNDIAIQYYGSVVYATDIAHANNMSITDDLTGTTITLPDIETTTDDLTAVKILTKNNTSIASKYPL